MTAMTMHFYSPYPLDEDKLFRRAPSIFTKKAHSSRSDHFVPIPTIRAVQALRREGFHPYGASESRCRNADRKPFTKHMLKFRRDDPRGDYRVGDSLVEIILTNANDGTSRYHLDAGIFKIACLNGLVIKSVDFGSLHVRHTGDALEQVVQGTYEVLSHAKRALDAPRDWSRIILDAARRGGLAKAAHAARFGDDDRITPEQLLIPRRQQDFGHDLWTVFNVLQENTVAGGLSTIHNHSHSRPLRAWTTRAIGGIDANMRLNRTLWQLAEQVASEG
jgi:hypothetical protein